MNGELNKQTEFAKNDTVLIVFTEFFSKKPHSSTTV